MQDCLISTKWLTVLRSHLNKLGLKIIHYRDYKKFSNDAFRSELVTENGNLQNFSDLDSLLAKCKNVLNRRASLKQKHVRANTSPFINKTILKAIMKQTRMKNKFISIDVKEKKDPTMHKGTCVYLVRKAKKNTLITLTPETSLITRRFGNL